MTSIESEKFIRVEYSDPKAIGNQKQNTQNMLVRILTVAQLLAEAINQRSDLEKKKNGKTK